MRQPVVGLGVLLAACRQVPGPPHAARACTTTRCAVRDAPSPAVTPPPLLRARPALQVPQRRSQHRAGFLLQPCHRAHGRARGGVAGRFQWGAPSAGGRHRGAPGEEEWEPGGGCRGGWRSADAVCGTVPQQDAPQWGCPAATIAAGRRRHAGNGGSLLCGAAEWQDEYVVAGRGAHQPAADNVRSVGARWQWARRR